MLGMLVGHAGDVENDAGMLTGKMHQFRETMLQTKTFYWPGRKTRKTKNPKKIRKKTQKTQNKSARERNGFVEWIWFCFGVEWIFSLFVNTAPEG